MTNQSKLAVFVKCPHPEMIEAISLAGFDMAVVDMEHTPLGPRDIYPLLLAAESREIDLVVRLPAIREEYFKWMLDLGVKYIQVPHVTCSSDVMKSIEMSYYSPLGNRGLCRFVRAADFSTIPSSEYIPSSNASTKLIFQVEGISGVENIESIVSSIPKGSMLFIGPYDLSQSLKKPGEIWDKEVLALMDSVINVANTYDVSVGTFTDTAEGVNYWKDKGLAFIEYSSDLDIFFKGADSLINC
jgi:4-hydroxy-2-oxoheptanedioate aldolase